jgi:hypothetical protein
VSGVIVQVSDSQDMNNRSSLIDMCKLRAWCYEHTKSEWHSYFMGTSDENKARGIGFVVFEFDSPNEELKFKLWTGA